MAVLSWGLTMTPQMYSPGPSSGLKQIAWNVRPFISCPPNPGTPLFTEMEAQGRIRHKDWSLYDTANVVFRPKLMTEEQLFEGYSWCYQRLFSHASIWQRRPVDWHAVLPYMAMSYLYKRSNRIWHQLIRYKITAMIWKPLVELTRRRHLKFRKRLAGRTTASGLNSVISAGV